MGSKNRIAKYIVPIIQKRIEDYDIHTFIDCFVGGANIIDKVKCDNKIASDNNKYLIALYQNLDKLDTLPEIVTKEHYDACRDCYNHNSGLFPDWYIGAVGFLASALGRFYEGGFCNTSYLAGKSTRNYYDEAKRNLQKQINSLQDITFQYGDYAKLYPVSDFQDCLFYCDIPYKGVKQYATSKNFDYEKFWDWATEMSEKNIVLVSEYIAPDNWECIWRGDLLKQINPDKKIQSIERLFEIREW